MPEADETSTRNAYDTVADVYADWITATDHEQLVELAMIDYFVGLLDEPRHVLDAGSGAGRMLPYLADRGCRPEGVDLSPQMVRRSLSDHPSYPCAVGSLAALEYADSIFDGVFSWYSTIHNPDDDMDRIVGEMVRVLRPGGYLLIAFQVGDGMVTVGEGFAAHGCDVVMNRYHRQVVDVGARLVAQGMDVVAQLEREPVPPERDPQAVVIARRNDRDELGEPA